MLYFDASFLVPLILEEVTSERIERFVAGHRSEQLTVSSWTQVEVSSVLAREVRMGGLSRDVALEADTEFDAILTESFMVMTVSPDDFAVARSYLRRYETGLRAGDALHLAFASNHHATAIYTLDQGLLTAGRHLHLPVATGIRLPRA